MLGNEPVGARAYIAIILLLVFYYGNLLAGWEDRIEWLQSLSPSEYLFRP